MATNTLFKHYSICSSSSAYFPDYLTERFYFGKLHCKMNLLSLCRNVCDSTPEDQAVEVKRSRFIIPHESRGKTVWDLLLLIATFYIAVSIPFEVSFFSAETKQSNNVLDIIVEILFIIDILLNFRTTFIKCGKEVFNAWAISKHYLTSWFLIDLVAAMPIELFVVQGTSVHLLKAIRLLRLLRLFQRAERYSEYSLLVVTLLMSVYILVAHWMACIWYVVGHEEMNTAQWHVGWLNELAWSQETPYINHTLGGPSTRNCYVAALYFIVTSMTTVGLGNVSANTDNEMIFAICAMFVGSFVHSVILGNVTSILQRLYIEYMRRQGIVLHWLNPQQGVSASRSNSHPNPQSTATRRVHGKEHNRERKPQAQGSSQGTVSLELVKVEVPRPGSSQATASLELVKVEVDHSDSSEFHTADEGSLDRCSSESTLYFDCDM